MHEPEPDIHRLWHDQPREEHAMNIGEIRVRADQFERRVRRWNVSTGFLFLAIIVVEGWQVWREPELVERVGDALTIAAFVYCAFWFRSRATIEAMPAGLALTTSLDFYRSQLASQRDVSSHPWRWLAVFVPGVGLSLLGRSLDRPPALTAAIAAFGVALFLAIAWVHRRTARKLQSEIDLLG